MDYDVVVLFGVGKTVFAYKTFDNTCSRFAHSDSDITSIMLTAEGLLIGSIDGKVKNAKTGRILLETEGLFGKEKPVTPPVTSILSYKERLMAFSGNGPGKLVYLDNREVALDFCRSITCRNIRSGLATSVVRAGNSLFIGNEHLYQLKSENDSSNATIELVAELPPYDYLRIFSWNNTLFDLSYAASEEYPYGAELTASLGRKVVACFPTVGGSMKYAAACGQGDFWFVTYRFGEKLRIYREDGLLRKEARVIEAPNLMFELDAGQDEYPRCNSICLARKG